MPNHEKHSGLVDAHRHPIRRAALPVFGALLSVMYIVFAMFGVWADASASAEVCGADAKRFRVAHPGSYTAFAHAESGPLPLDVMDADGELVARTPSEAANPGAVDLHSATAFGIPAPAVFGVDTFVDLHIHGDDGSGIVILVRLGETDEWSGLAVAPPTTIVAAPAVECPASGPLRSIDLDGIYSDVSARQAFVIPIDA